MTTCIAYRSPIIAALLLGATVAQADVTPADVWGEWKSQFATYGYGIDATETMMGSDLEVSNIQMTITVPEEEGTVTVKMPQVTFRDNGDGTVAIVMPSNMEMQMLMQAPEETVDATLNYSTVGLAMTASGTPEEMTYTYSAASMGMSLGKLIVDGNQIPFGTASVELTNVSGSQTNTGKMQKSTDQKFSADQLLYNIDIANPDNASEHMKIQGDLKDLAFNGTANVPMGIDMEDMGKALAMGYAFDGGFNHSGSNFTIDSNIDGDVLQGSGKSGSGTLKVAMDSSAMKLSAGSKDSEATMTVPDFPFPVQYWMAETGLEFIMPLAQTDEQQDFKLAVTLGDFSMAEMLWGLFDPAGQLPHDPATISFDLTGKVKLLANIFDPEAMESAEVPGEIHQASLSDLQIKAVGAELTGKGDFTFDNSDLASFDGLPRPEGELNLTLTGGNGLLDKLVAMGFVPESDAMGARMMMGMFTVPGEGEDSLKSKIEVNEQGHVLANGQRLK